MSFLFLTNLVIHVDSNCQSLLRDRTVIMHNGKPCGKNLQSADWCHLVSCPRTVKKCGELSRTYEYYDTKQTFFACLKKWEMSRGTLGKYEAIIILLHLFNLSNTYIQHTHHRLMRLEGFKTYNVFRTNLRNMCIKWMLNICLSVHKFHFQNHN